MRILVGTDFTEQAAEAANAAAALAAAWKEQILLAHVTELSGLAAVAPGVLEEVSEVTKRQLSGEAARLRETGIAVQPELLSGAAYEGLVNRAKPDFVRLIVVASHGRTTAGRWLLGSVSERVAESAKVPTLVVRDATPFAEWTGGERPLRIMVASDLTPTSDAALQMVHALEAVGPCEIIVAYVDSPLEERVRLGFKGPTSLTCNDPEVQSIIERDLKRHTTSVLGHERFKLYVEPNLGRPDFALAQIAEKEKADLIITGTHQRQGAARLWHMSFSRGLLHAATTNVLCVPLESNPAGSTIHPVKRVLVSTDLSDLGNAAIPQAFGLSRTGGVVHIIHVLPQQEKTKPLIGGLAEKKRPTAKQWAKLRKEVEVKLAELIPTAANELGIESEFEIVEDNNPATAICQAAERLDAEVICLATKGHTGLKSVLLGSVAQGVLAQTKRPVVLIKPVEA
jgi:nucleotide-binding universal stress UspA family protein